MYIANRANRDKLKVQSLLQSPQNFQFCVSIINKEKIKNLAKCKIESSVLFTALLAIY